MVTASDTLLFGAPQWLSGGAELAGRSEDSTALEIFELDTRQSRRLTLPVEARGTVDWSWSPGRVAADKAIVQWVQVPPCQLPASGT